MGLALKPPEVPPVILTGELGATARAMVASGQYVKVRRGVLTTAAAGLTPWQQRERSAMVSAAAVAGRLRNGAALSHQTAALVHGLWVRTISQQTHITQRSRPNRETAADVRRHVGALDPREVTTVNGMRVTTVERTIVDCAKTMHPRDGIVIADSGMRAILGVTRFDRPTFAERVESLRERLLTTVGQGPGSRRARAVILHADPFAESPPESVLRWIAVSRGLPSPDTQLAVRTRHGIVYADLGWSVRRRLRDGSYEARLVLVEYDGEDKYLVDDDGTAASSRHAARAVLKEKRREDGLREHPGTTVLRFDKTDLNDEEACFRRLLAALPSGYPAKLSPVADLLTGPRERRR